MKAVMVLLSVAVLVVATGCPAEQGSQNPNELPEGYVGHDEGSSTPDYDTGSSK